MAKIHRVRRAVNINMKSNQYITSELKKLFTDVFSKPKTIKVMFFLIMVSLITNAKSADYTISSGLFINSGSAKGHRLIDSLIHMKQVESVMDCAQQCLLEYCRCRSFNFETRKGIESGHTCELNNETRVSKPKMFTSDPGYDYIESIEMTATGEWLKDTCIAGVTQAESCADLYKKGERKDGFYFINPDGQDEFKVRCDMTTAGGGWTTFQRRVDGSVEFYRKWHHYKNGFGDLNGEFWLGLDKIHRLTSHDQNVLRVDMKDFEGEKRHACYDTFEISDEAQNYTLTVDGYSGNSGDSFAKQHNGMKFSTKDVDNDNGSETHCARKYKGAWWYQSCHKSNLNGKYLRGPHTSHAHGVIWYHWKGHNYSLKTTEMKIRPRGFHDC